MDKLVINDKSARSAMFLTWCTDDGRPVKVVCAYDGPIDPQALEHLANAIFNRVKRNQLSLEKACDAYQEGYLKLAQEAEGLLPPKKKGKTKNKDGVQSTLSGITSNASRRRTLLKSYVENAIHGTAQPISEEENLRMIRAILKDRVYSLLRNKREEKILLAFMQTDTIKGAAELLMQDKTSGINSITSYRKAYYTLINRIQQKLGIINEEATKGK